MNVVHLRASNFYGGPERQLHNHARLLRDSDIHLTVASFEEAGRTPEFLEVIASDGLTIKPIPASSAYDRSAIGRLRQYLLENDTDILATHDYRSHLLGYLATCRTDIRWLAFSRGFTGDNLKVRLFHWIEKILIRRADHIIAVSEAQKNKLVRLWVSPDRIDVVYNAIDVDAFAEVTPVDLRAQYSFPTDSTVVLAAGRLSREKGHRDLIAAVPDMARESSRFYLIVCGDGPEQHRLAAQVRRLGIEGRVILAGFVNNLSGYLKGADILVNPSHSEGLPNVVLEAMALRVPVVATAVGGVKELIKDGVDGLLTPARRPELLSQKIMQIGLDKELAARMVESAFEVVKSRFTPESQTRLLVDIYNRRRSE